MYGIVAVVTVPEFVWEFDWRDTTHFDYVHPDDQTQPFNNKLELKKSKLKLSEIQSRDYPWSEVLN